MLGINAATLVLFLYREHRSIVCSFSTNFTRFRTVVWKMSGLQTFVLFLRVLASVFPVAVGIPRLINAITLFRMKNLLEHVKTGSSL